MPRHNRSARSLAAATILGFCTPLVAAFGGASSASAANHFIPSRFAAQSALRAPMSKDDAPMIPLAFTTLDDAADPTFNQLLGINNSGVISGYFGSGATGHPNQGYTLLPPYGQGNYVNENFPGSVQTQVVAINNKHDTAGFWIDGKGVNRGFVEWNGVFTSYRDPSFPKSTVNQVLGLNDAGIGVGFVTDATGVNHGFAFNQATSQFVAIKPPGLTNVTATGINDNNAVVGFGVAGNGSTVGFLFANNVYTEFDFPGSTNTQPFGVNKNNTIVGAYIDGAGATHAFRLSTPLKHAAWLSFDDPSGIGTTLANGINDKGEIVGFYTDAAGNTDGFLAVP
jgi:hypothetical protein